LKVAAIVDDLVLKPNCSATSTLSLIKCYILTCKTFTKTVENAGKRNMGLLLDTSLYLHFWIPV